MIERSRVRIPAGAVGEFSSGSNFCADILPKVQVAGYS